MCLHSLHAPRQTKIRRAPIGIKKIKSVIHKTLRLPVRNAG